MKNRLNIFFILLMLIGAVNSYSQQIDSTKYLIATFERVRNKYKNIDGTQLFYMVIPVDSIKDRYFSLSIFLADGFAKSDLDRCISKKAIDPYTLTTATSFDFDSSYLRQLKDLNLMLKKQRKKVQTIIKKWDDNYVETVTVYLTPVTGNLTSSILTQDAQQRTEYSGLVFLPLSNINYSPDFWNSDKYKLIMFHDYSTTIFAFEAYR